MEIITQTKEAIVEKTKLQIIVGILRKLRSLNIEYNYAIHPETITCDQSIKYYQKAGYNEKDISVCKHVLLRDKKAKRFFLVALPHYKSVDMNQIRELFGTTKLSLASDEQVHDLLMTNGGAISLLGLIYDKEKKVEVILDEEIMDKDTIVLEPNYSGVSLFMESNAIYQYLNALGYSYISIEKEKKSRVFTNENNTKAYMK